MPPLWIALHLPLLSLETFAATLPSPGSGTPEPALALIDGQRVVAVNSAAAACGVKGRMRRATALALAPHILLGQAEPRRDAEALTAVAHAALAYTPQVVLVPADDPTASPHSVLLEVRASLRCFGGRERLLQRLHATLEPLGHAVQTAGAPTPRGALLLAQAHEAWHGSDFAAALDEVPVWLLGPGREHWEALQGMGLRTLADLRSLPRSGVARRFGPCLLEELDAAYGLRPDPREPIVLPPLFESRLELYARADTSDQLLHGAGILLSRLVAWLAAQHAYVRRYTLVMEHERRRRDADSDAANAAATALEIALAEPSRDAAHLAMLLRERLAQLCLPAPTLELRLHAADIARRAPPNGELFPTPRSERVGLTRLIERLQARLGRDQIRCVVARHDHRPEHASALCTAEPGMRGWGAHVAAGTAAATPRAGPAPPVWLLDPPEPLPERNARPVLDGRPLSILAGPERIEAGWWDAGLAERDYYIAQTDTGALVWVYRARLPLSAEGSGWYLQGRYG